MARTVEDSDDLEGLLRWIVNDQVHRIRLHYPKPERQQSQIFPHTTGEWRVGQKVAGPQNCFFNPIRRFSVVLAYEVPNLEEIADSFRR
jgi:hypothetical protein